MMSKHMFDNIFIVIEELHNQCIRNLTPYTNNLSNESTSMCNTQTNDKVFSLPTHIFKNYIKEKYETSYHYRI